MSDAQKEKIKGEIQGLVNTFNKGCEEANPEMLIPLYNNAPDFIYVGNGKILNYQELIDTTKQLFSLLLNQKGTIESENYIALDNTTVLFTQNSKWTVNFKDGHSVLQDPWIMQLLFKKVNNEWKVVSSVESGFEKSIPNEGLKGLNQVELHKQFVGNWKTEAGKDTSVFWDVKSYGTGIDGYFKIVTKGKIVMEGKQLWGYDKNLDKYTMSEMIKGMDNALYSSWFTSKDKCAMIFYSDILNPDNASIKYEVEFKSPDILVQTTIKNNKPVKVDTMTRVK